MFLQKLLYSGDVNWSRERYIATAIGKGKTPESNIHCIAASGTRNASVNYVLRAVKDREFLL